MNALRYFLIPLLIMGFVAQSFTDVSAMRRGGSRKRRASTDLAQAMQASLETEQAEAEAREAARREDEELLAQAIAASLAEAPGSSSVGEVEGSHEGTEVQPPRQRMRRTRRRIETVVIDDDNDDDSSAPELSTPVPAVSASTSTTSSPVPAPAPAVEQLFASPAGDIVQLRGLMQPHGGLSCGVYSLYFAQTLSNAFAAGGIRSFSEATDRVAFNTFQRQATAFRVRINRDFGLRMVGDYGVEELNRNIERLAIPHCWVGELRDGFYNGTPGEVALRPVAQVTQFVQQIRNGTIPFGSIIFNTGGGHWITIFMTPATMYVIDSADAAGSRCRAVDGDFHNFVVNVWNAAAPAPVVPGPAPAPQPRQGLFALLWSFFSRSK